MYKSAMKSAQAGKQCLQESYGKVGKLWKSRKVMEQEGKKQKVESRKLEVKVGKNKY